MAALVTHKLSNAGTAPTFVGASASDTAEYGNGGNTFAVYRETEGAAAVVTVDVQGNTDYGVELPDATFNVAANGEVWIPLRREYANGVDNGRATLKLTSGGADVAIVRVG